MNHIKSSIHKIPTVTISTQSLSEVVPTTLAKALKWPVSRRFLEVNLNSNYSWTNFWLTVEINSLRESPIILGTHFRLNVPIPSDNNWWWWLIRLNKNASAQLSQTIWGEAIPTKLSSFVITTTIPSAIVMRINSSRLAGNLVMCSQHRAIMGGRWLFVPIVKLSRTELIVSGDEYDQWSITYQRIFSGVRSLDYNSGKVW